MVDLNKTSKQVINELRSQSLSPDELLNEFEKILNQKDQEYQKTKKNLDELSIITDLIPNTISWIKNDLTYVRVNQALALACGMEAHEFDGRQIGFHTRERFFYEFASDLFHSKENTIQRELDAKINSAEKTFLVSGTKVANGTMAIVIGIDITEIKNLKGHVSLTEKLSTLGQMLAGIIHDINNPLMMIDASTKKIKKKTQDPEILEVLGKIELSASKVSKIVKGVKVFIRQDEETPFAKENLGQIIDDAVVILEHKLKENGVKLQYDIKLNQVEVLCNFTQLFQVFVNLFSNAVDAISTFEDKWIEVTIDETHSDNFYHIIVSDSGPGIPKEVQEKIFRPFFTTKGRGIGSGLGLSLCSQIIETHHGKIQILGDKKNTTFEILIPKILDK